MPHSRTCLATCFASGQASGVPRALEVGAVSVCAGHIEGYGCPYRRPMACGLRYAVRALQLGSKTSGAETRAAAGAAARIVFDGRNVDGPR